jgi:hypothetical protein
MEPSDLYATFEHYPEPDESNPHADILFFEAPFKYYLPNGFFHSDFPPS